VGGRLPGLERRGRRRRLRLPHQLRIRTHRYHRHRRGGRGCRRAHRRSGMCAWRRRRTRVKSSSSTAAASAGASSSASASSASASSAPAAASAAASSSAAACSSACSSPPPPHPRHRLRRHRRRHRTPPRGRGFRGGAGLRPSDGGEYIIRAADGAAVRPSDGGEYRIRAADGAGIRTARRPPVMASEAETGIVPGVPQVSRNWRRTWRGWLRCIARASSPIQSTPMRRLACSTPVSVRISKKTSRASDGELEMQAAGRWAVTYDLTYPRVLNN
jgi:hypothetical protein